MGNITQMLLQQGAAICSGSSPDTTARDVQKYPERTIPPFPEAPSLINKPAELPAVPHLLSNERTSQSKQKSSIVFNYPVQGGLGFLPDVHIISLTTTSSSLYWNWRADPKALPQKTPRFWGELRGWHRQGQRSLCPWSGSSGCLCFCRVEGSELQLMCNQEPSQLQM